MIRATIGVALLATGFAAHAQSYRCEIDGRVSYGDKPCPAGKQTTIAPGAAVDPAARADAAARQRRDEETLSRLDREQQQDQKAAALSKRRDTDIARHAQACAKLSRRVRDTHDAYDTSGAARPGEESVEDAAGRAGFCGAVQALRVLGD